MVGSAVRADARPVPFKPVRFFRLSERRQAELAAERLREVDGRMVRVIGCAGRGLRLEQGDDERRDQRPVERDRRRGA